MLRWIGFIKLFKNIFGKNLPDLQKIQNQGLLAVKIGQTFALRIDFLGEEKTTHLAKLYSHTDAVTHQDFNKILSDHVNSDWFEAFEYIEPTPLGSASVGQVHEAKLKSGEDVVVKAIKKDFKKSFLKDVKSFRRFLKFIIFFYPKLKRVADPIGILEHIEAYTLAELNLNNEIKNGEILSSIKQKNQTHYDFSNLRFPKIFKSLSNEHILVSEHIPGKTVDALITNQSLSKDKLLEIFRLHGFFVFIVGTFHGDMHPGNIIFHNDKFYFIDTGAISSVGQKIQKGLFNFMKHLAYYNYEQCAYALNEMAEKSIEGKAFDKYLEKLKILYKDFKGKTVSEISLTKKMMQTIKLGVHSGMRFEKGMFPIIKSMMYLDGIVLKGAPNMVLMEEMRPFIESFEANQKKVIS